MNDVAARADVGLAWGVKQSFLAYLRSTGDATVAVSSGAAMTRDGEFYFPLESTNEFDAATRRGTIRFGGSVQIDAHFGALSLRLADLSLVIGEQTASLRVNDVASTASPRPFRIADVAVGDAIADGSVLMWRSLPAVLAGDSVMTFGGAYPAGEPMDPLTVRIPAP